MSDQFTFGGMLDAIIKGDYIASNARWNGKGMWIKVQIPTELSKMDLPYLFMCNAQGELVPWTPSQMDLFSNEWTIKPYEGEDIKPIAK